jgi:4-diphosphocytidyl-2-C-methyl-D-erythritol kinase
MLRQTAALPGAENGSFIALRCDQPDLPCDRRNLVVKVGDAWAEEALHAISLNASSDVFPVATELFKRIPAGAGLGGGSSDAARMLLGLNQLWNTGREANSLSGFAARFGSDLPFFFFGPSSVCSGRGEMVHPVPPPKPNSVLLMLPPLAMPTAEVYRKFDAMKLGRSADVGKEPDWNAWSRLNARDLLDRLVNDLEPAAFEISPELAALRNRAESVLKQPVRMSGSGSSLFTLYETETEAEIARQKLLHDGSWNRVEAVRLAPDFTDDLNAIR